jgi:hypothetical protein
MAYESNHKSKWLGCMGILAILTGLALVVYLLLG